MKKWSQSAERNADSIARVLAKILPAPATVLEVGSGSGQHAVALAKALPSIVWQPSDRDEAQVDSIAAWRAEAALPNLKAPIVLDVTHADWDIPPIRAILAIDVVATAPWPVCVGLFSGAGKYLAPGDNLLLVGSDLPRPREEIDKVARSRGLAVAATHDVMGGPLLVFRRS